MQENEFEKKVRGLMDDLEIAPAAPVWDYVEKRIPKSNRRRRFIAFFLLLAGFTVCGYFVYHKFSNDKINNNAATAATEVAVTGNGEEYNSANHNSTLKDGSTTATTGTDTNIVTISRDNGERLSLKKLATNSLQITNEYGRQINIVNATIAQAESDHAITTDESTTSILQPVQDGKNDVISSIEPGEVIAGTDTIHTAFMEQPDTATTALTTSDTVKESKQAKQKINNISKKLYWGVSGFYGRSDVVENISFITVDKSYSWDGNLSSGNGNNYSNDSLRYDSQSKNVIAKSVYSIGINVRKPLSSRSSITTGIEFMHMNTQIQTGMPKDSTAVFYYNNSQTATRLENFYRPGIGSSQVNKYTIIQVPLLLNYRLNKNSKLPLSLDAGLSFTRVISSNALVYDSYNLAYYKNDELLRKTQVHLLGGFNTAFTFRNSSSLVLGPQFQYGLTGLVKNNSSAQHFFVWGLQARYYIKK
ncbi:hypothetical protein BH10BAC2_BH10BAC2_10930 [soil metagenome]